MNHYINIALIFWAMLFASLMFYTCVSLAAQKKAGPAIFSGVLSFLSLFAALLAIGQYIN